MSQGLNLEPRDIYRYDPGCPALVPHRLTCAFPNAAGASSPANMGPFARCIEIPVATYNPLFLNSAAFMRGEPEGPPTTNDASWLLKFYETFMDASDEDVTQCALKALSKLRGNFAFVLYDTGAQQYGC